MPLDDSLEDLNISKNSPDPEVPNLLPTQPQTSPTPEKSQKSDDQTPTEEAPSTKFSGIEINASNVPKDINTFLSQVAQSQNTNPIFNFNHHESNAIPINSLPNLNWFSNVSNHIGPMHPPNPSSHPKLISQKDGNILSNEMSCHTMDAILKNTRGRNPSIEWSTFEDEERQPHQIKKVDLLNLINEEEEPTVGMTTENTNLNDMTNFINKISNFPPINNPLHPLNRLSNSGHEEHETCSNNSSNADTNKTHTEGDNDSHSSNDSKEDDERRSSIKANKLALTPSQKNGLLAVSEQLEENHDEEDDQEKENSSQDSATKTKSLEEISPEKTKSSEIDLNNNSIQNGNVISNTENDQNPENADIGEIMKVCGKIDMSCSARHKIC